MNFISLDAEFNQPSEKMIQVAAVCGNLLTGDILSELNFYAKIDEPLNPFIVTLTGITDELLEREGKPLVEVHQKLIDMRNAHDAHRNPITWGGGDSQALREQLGISDTDGFVFGRRWIDIKTIFQMYCLMNDLKLQSGLARSIAKFSAQSKMKLQFKGRKHNALDDAKNTFILAHHLIKLLKQPLA